MRYWNVPLPPGKGATRETLSTMKTLTQAAARSDPRIRQKALDLLSAYRSRDPRDFARAVEVFVRSSVVLVDEPEEMLIDPGIMLQEIDALGTAYGDCDDASMLAAVLLYSGGIPVRFKAIKQAPDGSYQHVFTEYMLRGDAGPRWIPLDTTIDTVPVYEPGDCITEEL